MATITKGIKMSESFHAAVAAYAAEHGINWSRALMELAALGLQSTGKPIPAGLPQHGGNRRTNTPSE